jgi:hypothetical protein
MYENNNLLVQQGQGGVCGGSEQVKLKTTVIKTPEGPPAIEQIWGLFVFLGV